MGPSAGPRSAGRDVPAVVADLQAATRVLAGVALHSLDALDGTVTLAQFRMLSVLADLGRVRSVRVARALGLEASTVTRLADRLVTSGHVARGSEESHRGVVTLELTPGGQHIVAQVAARREQELSRIATQLTAADRGRLSAALRQLVEAAGAGYGTMTSDSVPL